MIFQYKIPRNRIKLYYNNLKKAVEERELQEFYNHEKIIEIANSFGKKIEQVSENWNLDMDIAIELTRLALYDIIIFADDSGSMVLEENGQRTTDLNNVISHTAYISSLFDDNGIEVRFINSSIQGNSIRNENEVKKLVSSVNFKGLTPLGSNLKTKVLEPLVLKPAREKKLKKPVLVIIITDGVPTGENPLILEKTIKNAKSDLSKTKYGSGALGLQFAQVGNDIPARDFLAKLDVDPEVGGMVDCTSNYEIEKEEMESLGTELTYETWLVKMFLGAIDPKYDEMDE
ncbi:uncharacterized protein SAPINGB_P000287 [Magnusiomyces paraingens]|uniref:VWFA domain-containing protein n=1 Tax=Magnusiomyces paraingens TaxID=2606893 RepID=A0A5E8B5A6_9ASCO|nr:uncharacterized protein SAPINGB_P000287 [Saprochaete ingens]VVT44070.1 unnamed protein product [Saprochaete ingens]